MARAIATSSASVTGRAVPGASYAFEPRWSHPSLGGARLLPRYPEFECERRWREAERRVLEAVRLCDAAAPLDTVASPQPQPQPQP